MIPKSPHISRYMEKKYVHHSVISLNGKIIGIGKNTTIAVENAKKKMPDIEEYEYLISHVYPKLYLGSRIRVRES